MWGELWAARGALALLADSFGPRGKAHGFGRFTHEDPDREDVNEKTVRQPHDDRSSGVSAEWNTRFSGDRRPNGPSYRQRIRPCRRLDPGGFDCSVEGHLDVVFGKAERRGAGIDIHLHDPGALGIFELGEIARRTRALGMAGRVVVSHAYALGQVEADIAKRAAHDLAEAGVAIMTNAPGDRSFPRINLLR
jgi:hypothetical protein